MYNTSPSTIFASRPMQQAYLGPGSPRHPDSPSSRRRSTASSSSLPAAEDGGRPRRESRNDLFSMDWKWRGDATGTELREELKPRGEQGLVGLGLREGAAVGRQPEHGSDEVRIGGSTVNSPTSPLSTFPKSIPIPNPTSDIPPQTMRLDSPPLLPSTTSSRRSSQIEPGPFLPRPPCRSSMIERRIAHIEIGHRPSTDPDFRLKVDLENRRSKLGSGRYSNVHLGRYSQLARTRSEDLPEDNLEGDLELGMTRTGWNICAVRVFNGDEEGWEMAEKESEVLSLLTSPPVDRERGIRAGSDGKVVRGLGLVTEDEIELDDDLEETLRGAGLWNGPYALGPGSPRATTGRPPGAKGIDGLGKGLPGRIVQREEERRSVSDSRLVERAAMIAVTGARDTRTSTRRSIAQDLARPMLVVEYIPGGTVEAFTKRFPERVDVELWTRWMGQGLLALDRVRHHGVIHCDVKPANLLLDDELNLVVADFSSSVIVRDDDDLPTDGIGRGTPPYSSPEMVDPCPTRTFGYASDVFSFGATMYSLITGSEPFRGVRSIELMWNVRKGRFWEWEERARVMRVGQVVLPVTPTTPGSTRTTVPITSPPPRMMGHFTHAAEGIRRTGSLRESVLSDRKTLERPKLPRMSSSELLLVAPDTNPLNGSHPNVACSRPDEQDTARDLFSLASRVQTQGSGQGDDGPDKRARAKSLRIDTRLSNSLGKNDQAMPSTISIPPIEPYSDGTPAMMHLNGLDRVEEVVWRVLKRMVDPVPEKRGTPQELLKELFGV